MEAWKILTIPKIEIFVEEHLEDDPSQIALKHRNNEFPAGLVSTRIKYLQKARKKLPVFYDQRCLFPPKAYEQCTSEAAANLKKRTGARALDLTCGLGVDTWNWARQFKQVIALEPDPELFPIVQHNFNRLGIRNVQLLQLTAEAFLESYQGPPFDLIYADPDRRTQHNDRLHDPRQGSPHLESLWPQLEKIGSVIMVKLSPMVEIAEIPRLFPNVIRWVVLSVSGECKEVLVECSLNKAVEPRSNECWISRGGSEYFLPVPEAQAEEMPDAVNPEAITYLAEPDVSAYKAHALRSFLQAGAWKDDWAFTSNQGFFISSQSPQEDFPGRILEVEWAIPFKPKVISKLLKQHGITQLEITRRGFPQTVAQVRKMLKIKAGGPYQLWLTEINQQKWGFIGKEKSGLMK